MYFPFEGNGVDGNWQLRMPKASNRLDYNTIADVLITIEFLALHNYDYGQQVIQQLKPTLRSDRAFSFRNDFPDAWYDLHIAQLIDEPQRMVVRVKIARSDFPIHIENIRMQNVMLYFSRADGLTQEVQVEYLKLIAPPANEVTSTTARSIDGTISTRRRCRIQWSRAL